MTESNAFFDDARARLNALAQRQDSMMSFMLGDRSRLDDINIPLIGCDDFQLPKFEMPSKDIRTLKDMPSFDGSVFAEWRKADLPVMFITGILGGLASYFLRDFFASLHDHWGNDLTTLEGGAWRRVGRLGARSEASGRLRPSVEIRTRSPQSL